MRTRVTIGDFSRASQLSVKTLRHYHEVRLLEPDEVDPDNGYRYYSEDQIPLAQVIRRLRGLQMPVADVKSVLAAPDSEDRNRLIVEHLEVSSSPSSTSRRATSAVFGYCLSPSFPQRTCRAAGRDVRNGVGRTPRLRLAKVSGAHGNVTERTPLALSRLLFGLVLVASGLDVRLWPAAG